MLDLLPSVPEGSNTQLPMDLSQYLLAASPPMSEFNLMGYAPHSHNHFGNQNFLASSDSFSADCPFHQPYSLINSPENIENYNFSNNVNNLNRRNNTKRPTPLKLKSIIMKSELEDQTLHLSDSQVDPTSPVNSRPQSPGRTPKSVTFADHRGLPLAQVKIVKESPDEPPTLSPSVLSSLTLGANADVDSKPPIKLCFAQPASDYLAFRDKIQSNLVSLENVILRDYMAEGTIKVKNITFEKRVLVRLSLDEWVTSEDHEAVYIPGPGLGSVDPFDTFSFKMEISPSFDVHKKVQFAVCFCENGKEHWDNNGGDNYCIMSEDCEELFCSDEVSSCSERYLPIKKASSWTAFSAWRDLSPGGPYY